MYLFCFGAHLACARPARRTSCCSSALVGRNSRSDPFSRFSRFPRFPRPAARGRRRVAIVAFSAPHWSQLPAVDLACAAAAQAYAPGTHAHAGRHLVRELLQLAAVVAPGAIAAPPGPWRTLRSWRTNPGSSGYPGARQSSLSVPQPVPQDEPDSHAAGPTKNDAVPQFAHRRPLRAQLERLPRQQAGDHPPQLLERLPGPQLELRSPPPWLPSTMLLQLLRRNHTVATVVNRIRHLQGSGN